MASPALTPEPDGHPKLVRRVRLRTDPINGGPVLLTQETVVLLNATGHAVLSRCDGSRTLSQITAELEALYSDLSPASAQEILTYLARLTEKGWVEWR